MHVEGDRCLQRGRRESAQSNVRAGFGGRLLQQPHDCGTRSARALVANGSMFDTWGPRGEAVIGSDLAGCSTLPNVCGELRRNQYSRTANCKLTRRSYAAREQDSPHHWGQQRHRPCDGAAPRGRGCTRAITGRNERTLALRSPFSSPRKRPHRRAGVPPRCSLSRPRILLPDFS